ncbi:MAG: ABC transporter ATP-binding protein, partial [Sediminibacterium sp.]
YNIHNLRKAKIMEKQGTLQQIPRLYLELLAVMGLSGLIIMMLVQGKPLSLLLPTLGVFVVGAFRMIPSVNRIMISIQGIKSAEPVVQVLYDEFKMFERAKEPDPVNAIHFTSEIIANNVSFKYESAKSITLKNVSISIKKGESVGFFGSSGSGKSTLVDIILGLLKANEGAVTVDGVNIQDNIRSWQTQIGYVPQTIYLTDDSLLKNIAFGVDDENIDLAAVNRAIDAAQLNEFISSLPDGMQTKVGERGVRLSGGQRQRIGIARALYHDPEFLVLDEATSSLDNSTESAVMEAVNLLRGQKTLLIVAHRLSTLKHCDRLYQLSKGIIIKQGSVENMIPGVV